MTFQTLALIAAPSASAVVTCSFAGGVMTVDSDPGNFIEVGRNLTTGTIQFFNGAWSECTPVAPFATTTTINVNGDTGAETLGIEMWDVATGLSAVVSWGTINWNVNLGIQGAGTFDEIFIDGFVNTAMNVAAGATGIDLNNDGDNDVTYTGVEFLDIAAGTSSDTLSAAGSTATGGPVTIEVEIDGNSGDDTIAGGSASDGLNFGGLNGDAGLDVIAGGLGDDTIDGGADEDAADYRKSATAVIANLATGNASGEGLDTLVLGTIENLYGSPLGDTLTGDALPNKFRPGLGDDTVNGGASDDRVDYRDAPSGVIVDLTLNKVTGGAGTDTLSSIQDATGSEFDDEFIDPSESPNDNEYRGRGGNDVFDQGVDCTLLGDVDFMDGEGGLDTVDYSQRTDGLTVDLFTPAGPVSGDLSTCGEADQIDNVENAMLGTGDDTFTGNAFNNIVFPGGGQNVLTDPAAPVGGGIDTVNYSVGYTEGVTVNMAGGGPSGVGDSATGFENAVGTDFNDTIIGTDVVGGTTGANSINGRGGNDNLSGNAGPDTVNGGGGNDTIRLGAGDDNGNGKAGNDFITGSGGDDFINGGKGKDTCDGGSGHDRVKKCEKGKAKGGAAAPAATKPAARAVV
jgi:Ca2+-binding RTX toxin-like protein